MGGGGGGIVFFALKFSKSVWHRNENILWRNMGLFRKLGQAKHDKACDFENGGTNL